MGVELVHQEEAMGSKELAQEKYSGAARSCVSITPGWMRGDVGVGGACGRMAVRMSEACETARMGGADRVRDVTAARMGGGRRYV